MGNKKKLAIVGGDLRQVKMAEDFSAEGYDVKVFGFNKEGISFDERIKVCSTLEETLREVDVVIMGLPMSLDDETLNAPLHNGKIYIKEIFKVLDDSPLLIGGRISEKVNNLIKVHGVYAVDYFEREELKVQNAIPSAEGAIQIAMEETTITIHGSSCLVLGFGRLGKMLSKMLSGIGARVTCAARRCEDIAWIKGYGYDALSTDELSKSLNKFDVIFNTIPSRILGMEELSCVSPDCLIIDLASKPGGVDMDAAAQLDRKVIWALSLPGKVAPSTAGEIIKNTVVNIMNELGV